MASLKPLSLERTLKKYVVESYMDSIAMYEHGMTNSVATLGIATNRFHIQKLLQIVNEIVFCLMEMMRSRVCSRSSKKCIAFNYRRH